MIAPEVIHMRGMGPRLVFLALVAAATVVAGGCALFDFLNPPLAPPNTPPEGVNATRGELNDAVRVSWQGVEGATRYRVFRAPTEEGEYQFIGETDSASYLDRGGEGAPLQPGTWHWYRVQACNAAGCSDLSQAASGYAGYPPAPTWVQATDGGYPDRIVISWDPVPGATEYQVYRDAAENGTYSQLVGQSSEPSIEDHDVSPGNRYWYRVRACNDWGCSLPSEARDSGCVEPCPVP